MKIEEILQEAHRAYLNKPLFWAKMYCPHHFRSASPEFHEKIMDYAMKYRYFAIAAPRESAKAQSVDSKVIRIVDGEPIWWDIGSLEVGDNIISPSGKTVKVTHVHPVSSMDLYRVTFRDGRSTLCNLDHLWRVKCPSNTKKENLLPLRDIIKNYKSSRFDRRFNSYYEECRYYVDCPKPLEYPESVLPVDPYTFGYWLGDGHSRDSRVTTADPEIFDYIPYEYTKNKKKYTYNIKGITSLLRGMGVLENKHIPSCYLYGSIKQRIDLIQGLVDSDGHIPKKKSAGEFTNKNKRIIDGFVDIVRSLGGRASVSDNYTYCNNKRFKGYRVHFHLPKNMPPCKLKRKLDNWRNDPSLKLYITDISLEETDLGRCITVDASDGMYLTDDYIPTHNSTVLAFVRPLHAICFKQKHFIVILQNTYAKAAGTLTTIKQELRENPMLLRDFKIRFEKDAEGDTIAVHPDGFKTRILCKGADQMGSVRGEKFGAWRPDLIIIDDLEDDEMVRSLERRIKCREDFDSALVPAGDRETCHYIAVGTILHDDALIAHLTGTQSYLKWRKLFYRAREKNRFTNEMESLWEEKWSLEWLNNYEKEKPDTFAKEYQNDPVSGRMSKFDKADFRQWTMQDGDYLCWEDGKVVKRGSLKDCVAAISCDLAWEEKKSADDSVIMPGLLTPDSDLLIDTYINKKGMKPNEMEEYIFQMEEKYRSITGKSVKIGFEKGKLEKVAQWFLKNAMKRRNHFLMLKDLSWGTDKVERIVTKLQPRYSMHSIYHKSGMGDLENQLLRIPSGRHDDLADAAQGLVQLLVTPYKPKKKNDTKEDEFNWYRNLVLKANSSKYIPKSDRRKTWGLPAKKSFR